MKLKAAFTSRAEGVNCQKDPYSFSGAKLVAAMAKRKSDH